MDSARDLYASHVRTVVACIQEILAETGYDRLVLHSGAAQLKSPFDDQDWPFQPVPLFAYLAPLPWPDCVVVVGARGDATLFALESGSFWERRAQPDWGLLEAALSVERIASVDAMHAMSWDGRSAFVSNDARDGIVTPTMDVNPPDVVGALHEQRTVKTPWEVACIEQASLRAARGHHAIAAAFDAGERSELALHLTYLAASQQDDADCPYKNIVALGAHGATLHHIDYQAVPEAGSLLVDAGARALGYCSDITRTHVVSGSGPAGDRFANLVDHLEQLQLRVIGQIEPGLSYEALHDRAHEELGQLLVEAGIVQCSAEAAVATGITRVFLPHGLGHHLGLQVHDVAGLPKKPRPENRFLRNTRVIEPGQVFTIEPGLYFIDALLDPLRSAPEGGSVDWDAVDALRPFGGIRIEDNVLVRAEGDDPKVRNFTREAFSRA
jgi:Xaa-Pro dipeptidase